MCPDIVVRSYHVKVPAPVRTFLGALPFELGMATSCLGRLEGCYCVALMFLMRTLGWTLLFVVNRQGWSNFTPWKVRQISVLNQRAKGTGGPFSKTGSQTFSSMHRYVLGEKWDIKVYGEVLI